MRFSCNNITLPLILLTLSSTLSNLHGQTSPPTLYADHKARSIGEMVTILVTESANAKRESKADRVDDNAVDVEGSVDGNLLQFLPVFGLRSNLKADSRTHEGSSQKDQLTGRISAVITDVTPGGLFVVSGSKLININGERNLMTIKGQVRPRDILSNNTVYSYNIADSRIYYSKPGVTGKYIRRGTFPRMANLIMGGAGLALIGYVGGISALSIIRSFAL
ncbi:MAG: flagellar basal body L-ring protein FlgH [Candidatus Marinimicrobia bacterium]|nr:flagellar basal body L-ring protein FlgH [Candidatus Neomarinimicrobiota bacterium]